MDSNDIRVWCMQQPRPAVVRVTNADGATQEVLVQGQWTKLADTLATLQPELLEALNADKQLIRAIAPNDLTEDWEPDDKRTASTSSRRAPASPASFVGIPITASDPETQRFALVGALLADAYKDSNAARDSCFAALTDIVEKMQRRSESVERAKDTLHKIEIQRLRQQIEEAGQEPVGSPDGELTLQSLLGPFLQGMGAGGAEETAASAKNGKAS